METMTQIFKKINSQKGFTLVEVLVSMAIFGMIVAGITASRLNQQSQGMSQQQAIEIQQNVRGALSILNDQIRMAGYNPYGGKLGPGINSAITRAGNGVPAANGGTGRLTFVCIADDDGFDNDDGGSTTPSNVDEKGELKTVSYYLKDLNGDGVANELTLHDAPLPLTTTYEKLIAENIAAAGDKDQIDNDGDGAIDEADEAKIIFTYLDDTSNPIAISAANVSDTTTLNRIRAVTISIKGTTPLNELDFSYSARYGHNNTRTLVTTVKCRNLGL